MFHHLRQINTIKYNQATQEAILRAGDVQPKCQQKTPPSITDSHRRCTPDDRKSKQGGEKALPKKQHLRWKRFFRFT